MSTTDGGDTGSSVDPVGDVPDNNHSRDASNTCRSNNAATGQGPVATLDLLEEQGSMIEPCNEDMAASEIPLDKRENLKESRERVDCEDVGHIDDAGLDAIVSTQREATMDPGQDSNVVCEVTELSNNQGTDVHVTLTVEERTEVLDAGDVILMQSECVSDCTITDPHSTAPVQAVGVCEDPGVAEEPSVDDLDRTEDNEDQGDYHVISMEQVMIETSDHVPGLNETNSHAHVQPEEDLLPTDLAKFALEVGRLAGDTVDHMEGVSEVDVRQISCRVPEDQNIDDPSNIEGENNPESSGVTASEKCDVQHQGDVLTQIHEQLAEMTENYVEEQSETAFPCQQPDSEITDARQQPASATMHSEQTEYPETIFPELPESKPHSEQLESQSTCICHEELACPDKPESENTSPEQQEAENTSSDIQDQGSENTCLEELEPESTFSEQQDLENTSNEQQDLETVCLEKQESENSPPDHQEFENTYLDKMEPGSTFSEQQDLENTSDEQQDMETVCPEKQESENSPPDHQEFENTYLHKMEPGSTFSEQQELENTLDEQQNLKTVCHEKQKSENSPPEHDGLENTCLEELEPESTFPEQQDLENTLDEQQYLETVCPEKQKSENSPPDQQESENTLSYLQDQELENAFLEKLEPESTFPEQWDSQTTFPEKQESENTCAEEQVSESTCFEQQEDGVTMATVSLPNLVTDTISPDTTELEAGTLDRNSPQTDPSIDGNSREAQDSTTVLKTVEKTADTANAPNVSIKEECWNSSGTESRENTVTVTGNTDQKQKELTISDQEKKDSSKPPVKKSDKESGEKNLSGTSTGKGPNEKTGDDTSAAAKTGERPENGHTSTTPVKSKDSTNVTTSKPKESPSSKDVCRNDSSDSRRNQSGSHNSTCSPLKPTSLGLSKVQVASPGRDGKGPAKIERYSEQRQRKSASRATDRSERKDVKGKNSSSGGKEHSSSNLPPASVGGGDMKGASAVKGGMPTAAELEAQWQREEEEKKRVEEERRKEEERLEEERCKEEEKRKLEEEERLKAEEAQRLLQEELKLIDDYITEAKEKILNKAELREKNLTAAESRPDESFFTKLDSSLKRNTAFVKKLKNLTDSQKDALIKDFQGLNLSKYIGECAAAIAEAKLKMSDVGCGVFLSSLLYQRYTDFAPALLDNWQKFLLNKKDEKIPNPSKYRVDLRFFAELVSVGVFMEKEGLHILANQLAILITNDKEEHNNLSTITSFCKHCGDDYAGLVPRKIRELAEKHKTEVPRSGVLRPVRQKACRNLLKDYYQSLCKHLTKDYKDLKNRERQNLRTLQTKGELSNEKKEAYEAALTGYQKLHGNSSTLADLLDEDMPDLPDEDFNKDPEAAAFDVFNPMSNAEYKYEGDTALFEDEETRSFYETLPDLKAFIPGILYKESEQATRKDATKDVDMDLDLEEENLQVEDVEKEMETEQSLAEIEQQAFEKELQENPCKDEEDETDLPPNITVPDDDEGETVSLMKSQFEAYILSLPNCVNRDLIDKAAIEFLMNFNTKSNRKKLVRALFTVHRTRYDLLAFYSRFVAILYPCMPDLANDLVHLLKGDFKWHIRKKDQINIESKLKTVRFVGEMVKFNMFPKSESLHCVKMLMFDFSHHNIEMACALLEACGRYLYRSPESHHRTKVYLDVMMRKKAALHLEGRYTTMIENAYYYSNPPDTPQMVRKVRPPIQEYMRRLLYKDLSKTTTEKVLRQMRKLDWDDAQISFYATKCLTAIWNVRYNSVHCAANLLAGLAPYHEPVAIQVVDGILEDIRLGMEVNHPKYNQRRVSSVKYLGELYNYRMVESTVVFKMLYSFITFGVSLEVTLLSCLIRPVFPVSPLEIERIEEAYATSLDPPEHLFRMRLTCVLLDTCGQYFDKGSSKKKLDCFLVYFQRYYWFKRSCSMWTEDRPFPIDVKNMVQDTFETVRPKLKMLASNEEASKAAEELDNEFKSKLANILPACSPTEEGNTSGFEDQGLTTIQESEEMDELSEGLSQTPLTDDGPSTVESETSQDESRTGSQAQSETGRERRTSDEEEDDVLESAGEDESEDQVTVLSGGPKFVNCAEDDDFMAAFDKMMTDNIQARNSESLKVPQLDIAVPVHLKSGQKKIYAQLDIPEKEEAGAIKFVLMTRKGNKQQFSNLNVPISEEFAAKFKERERAEKAEKERMKQVVLGIHERQEEEDYQEMIASLNRPAPVNTNRERRVHYQHPKGAPDADAIFGSKKR